MPAVTNPPTLETLEQRQVTQHLDDLGARLLAEYRKKPDFAEDRVIQTIKLARDRFSDVRIHAFLPILIERAVRRELDH
jgi:hypothetical protein